MEDTLTTKTRLSRTEADWKVKPEVLEFDTLRLRLASPEVIRSWSYGEVTKPETINYRTQKPEKDGLFDERIFGPTKDWECYCGKYKKIRYKGIICDKCGVEVTHSLVRRERMGHIELQSPVAHIWFLRGVPSKLGLVLDISVQNLERVIYFGNYLITKVEEKRKTEEQTRLESELKTRLRTLKEERGQALRNLSSTDLDTRSRLERSFMEREKELLTEAKQVAEELQSIALQTILSEHQFHALSVKFGHLFEAGMGAEAVLTLLNALDISQTLKHLKEEILQAPDARKDKLVRRMKVLKNFLSNKIDPAWMILRVLPVIPPDLRPMVALDGGRFATSDLNDLYRRVINRNNRLRRLLELNAPEVIVRNEKRMLQEAVDALIDNSARHAKTATAPTGARRQLRSLADILKGKQGRFRQNLLGKRTDYSGRSVIVVGPTLKLHQCGLPKRMALELFKPHVIGRLIAKETVHNIRSAARLIDSDAPIVWDLLDEVVKDAYVFLNRAPTLHRLGIQAFQPILIEGKAIQIHPLVCPAFNADFDGDQMAVHVPLTEEAKAEARDIMLSSKNLLKPAHGNPVATPTNKDMGWGCFYLTSSALSTLPRLKTFSNAKEALLAYQLEIIGLQETIRVHGLKEHVQELLETTVGRIIFNQALPEKMPYYNHPMDVKKLGEMSRLLLELFGAEKTAPILDELKALGFRFITQSGYSWSMEDLPALPGKQTLLTQGDLQTQEVEEQYTTGLLTSSERHTKIIEIWSAVKEQVFKLSKESFNKASPVYSMVESGARGSWGQLTQMVGMKGLVANPAGEIIELPIKASFKDGFSVMEYFIATHGSRKGLSDTALRTANAGYLTRRLVDVAQDVVVREEDCGDLEGVVITRAASEEMGEAFMARFLGRFAAQDIKAGRKTLVKNGAVITEAIARAIEEKELGEVKVRSVLHCKTRKGLCQKCYGYDLGYNRVVALGVAVGIVAAQSIGEPGTQLTMRTFHTGGVAGLDITQGLPRVEELFEVRIPKKKAFLAEGAGTVTIETGEHFMETATGKKVIVGQGGQKILRIQDRIQERTYEYVIPPGYVLWVKDDEKVAAGTQLTEGALDPRELYRISGRAAVEQYLIKEIQGIYSSQGQKLNDKHIEVIVRQMFSRILITEVGDTDLLPGEMVERAEFEGENERIGASGAPAQGEELLLGVTKVSLSTHSFLSAASFQETARVLINAAVSSKMDNLEGLKENVIIGRLIPAGTGFKKI